MVLSVFGARLVQLQGIDPKSYAAMAAAEGVVEVVLPAERGDILDRNGQPLADSVEGLMVVADPYMTTDKAPELAKFLSQRLDVDYFSTLKKLRAKGSRFEFIARRVPSTKATDVVQAAAAAGFKGIATRRDPVRDYPAGDVAANLIGFMGTDEPLGGFERTFQTQLAGKDGSSRYDVGGGNRIPLGDSTIRKAVDGQDLHTTIDQDLQWYTQRVLRQTVQASRGDSGVAIVMDTRTGELLSLADYPTFDANAPLEANEDDLGSRAISDVFEPGSVEKVLTLSSLIDAGKVTPHTELKVPGVLTREDHPIRDWFPHDLIRLTLAGVIAKSSNIGTVLAADKFDTGELFSYLTKFGLGQRTNIGVRGETPGILPDGSLWTHQNQDRIAFGQSLSVNAVQMIAAVNTIANGGVRVSPSVIEGHATTDEGVEVGTDTTTTRRVVSPKAATGMAHMMERVVDPEVGVAPGAAVPGYRVAGKTGTAQRAGTDCGCYDGTFTVSFAGFAPADDPRFTIYVVVQNPRNGGGGGSVAGPAFSKIMSYALRRYAVPPTGTRPSHLPVEW
ncbi:penicillin-binding protein 2 [Nocardioides sp. KIGAM211]|uniref:Penicillin-binding protein 2 n=2 Tax=Nocardioides luti TaxID=2761101 RepID=A0A7X0RDK1_9ACTN|nr:penicillin-binding protein 2 [Nocardioides luti]